MVGLDAEDTDSELDSDNDDGSDNESEVNDESEQGNDKVKLMMKMTQPLTNDAVLRLCLLSSKHVLNSLQPRMNMADFLFIMQHIMHQIPVVMTIFSCVLIWG